jgi:hypothetical protein
MLTHTPTTCCRYVKNLTFLGAWEPLQSGCREHMDRLGVYLDRGVYAKQSLFDILSRYAPNIVSAQRRRMAGGDGCVCACVRVCVRACVRACVCVCVCASECVRT